MSTAHTAFLDYVLPHVPGCTNEMALLEIKNTLVDFCEKTQIIQVDHDPIGTIANIQDYDLEPPTGYLVVKILKAWFKGVELAGQGIDEIKSPSQFNQNSGYVVDKGDPRYIYQKDARSFSVYPIPNTSESQSLTLRVALKPTRSATTIDNFIFEEYAETIGHGVITRLALSPGKPYSNPSLAAARNGLYLAGVNVARDRALKGYVRTSKHVKMRRI